MAVGHKVRELRIKRGLTQSDLADGIVTPSMISLIESERANPSEKVLRALAERLGVSLEDIVGSDSSDWEQSSTILITHSLLLANQPEAAKNFLLSRASDSSIPELNYCLLLAECYIHEGNATKALDLLVNLEERYQNDASAVFLIWKKTALLYGESGNVELASHYWKKAFQICMENSAIELYEILDCVRQMCLFYLEEERFEEIAQILAEFRTRWNFPKDMRELAVKYLESAMSSEEEKRYRVASVMAHRAFTLLKTAEMFEGLSELQLYESIVGDTESRISPENLPKADHRLLARHYLRTGSHTEALEHARRAVNDAQSPYQKAVALQVLAEVQEARQEYLEAAETIRQVIAIWEALGSSKKAARFYSRLTHILLKVSETT